MKLKFTSLLLLAFLVLPIMFLKADTRRGGNGPHPDSSAVPDAYGYKWKDNTDAGGPAYNFRDTTSVGPGGSWTRVTGLSDDNNVGPYSLGFNFRYYYYNVTRLRIGSNGYLLFETGSEVNTSPLNSGFPSIPSATVPNNYIGVYGADLIFGSGVGGNQGSCYIYRNNSDSVIVNWYDVPLWQSAAPGYNGSHTFQCIMTKSDSSVTMMYKSLTGTLQPPTTGNALIIGIENITGGIGLQRYGGAGPTPIVNNTAIKYYYPRSTTFTVKDAGVTWVDNTTTGGIFKLTNDTLTVKTRIANTGNVPTGGSFLVSLQIKDTAGVVALNDSATVPALNAETDTLVTFTKKFIVPAAKRYSVVVTTLLTGDAVTSNNVKTLELNTVSRTSPSLLLRYDNGTNGAGVSWTGGTGSVSNYFIPPIYPARIDTIRMYISTNTTPTNSFFGKIFKDDGTGGLPGTQLFTSAAIVPVVGAFNSIVIPGGVTISSGGFYVTWVMNGDQQFLGEDIVGPISNRSFEGLGSSYAPYRNGSTNDPMIRAVIKNPLVAINPIGTVVPEKFSLSQNYPNPFNPSTVIAFNIAKQSFVSLKIFDILGREVKDIINSNLAAGSYNVDFNASELTSGIYFYTLTAEGFTDTKRMLLVK